MISVLSVKLTLKILEFGREYLDDLVGEAEHDGVSSFHPFLDVNGGSLGVFDDEQLL